MCQKFRDALAAWNTERYVSMRQCAEAFGVPRTSLNDMIRESLSHGHLLISNSYNS